MRNMETGLQAVKPEEWPVGSHIKCPRCGARGKAGVSVFRAKGREYVYLVVNHPSGRKCIVGRPPAAAERAILQTVKRGGEEERLREENEKLRAELERLRAENERLREENRQLREAVAAVYNAKLVRAGEWERECLRKVAIQRRTGLPEEVRATAWRILGALAGEDWAAVRLEAFEQLARFL